MLEVALPVLVHQTTGSAASTAAMMFVGMVPAVVLSPVTGVLADRADRRLLLLVCVGQAVVALPLLVVGGYVVVLVAAAGALVVPFGDRGRAPAERRPAVREWLDGLDLIRGNRRLWVVGAAMVLMAAAQGMFLVLFVLDVLRAGPEGVQAVGGLLAGLGSQYWPDGCHPLRCTGGERSRSVSCPRSAGHAHGFGAGLAVYVGLVSTLQRAVPPAAVGRLTSTAFAGISLGTAARMLITGRAATWPPILDVQAAGYLVGGAAVLIGENGR